MLSCLHRSGVPLRVLLSFLVVLGAVLQVSPQTSRDVQAQETSTFVDAECPFALPPGLIEGDGIACGYLSTPLIHGGGGTAATRLAVARIASTAAEPAAEPLVVLLGGPGQEVETILPAFAPDAAPSYRSLLERQDVLLLEQRGIGYSEPSLACPFDSVGGRAATESLLATDDFVAAFSACAAGYRSEGIDLEAFDSIQSAADVDALRGSLGYDQIDLLGISYGTRLALTIMRDFPESVRSAVLASPLPLQANVVAGQIVGFDAALDRLFGACSADSECGARYPDLDGALTASVERLDAEPLLINAIHPLTNNPVEIVVDDAMFLQIVYVATFIGQLLQFVPALVHGVVDDNNVVLETLAPYSLILTSGVSLGASYVINCNEEFTFTDAATVADLTSATDIRPELRSGEFSGTFDTFPICDSLGVAPAAPTENGPVQSDVPSLISTGEFDPITPPSYGEMVAETLPNSVTVVIEGVSHDPVSTGGPCGFALAGAFLASPTETLDTACADDFQLEFVIVPA